MTLDLLHEEEYEALRKRLHEETTTFSDELNVVSHGMETDYRTKSFNAMLSTLSIAAVIIVFALIVLVNI